MPFGNDERPVLVAPRCGTCIHWDANAPTRHKCERGKTLSDDPKAHACPLWEARR